jgi:hypothetical protein
MKVKDLETASNFLFFIFLGSENCKHLINNHFIDNVTFC